MPTKLLGALAIIVIFSIVMERKNRRRREATWTGLVTEIKHQRPATRDEDRNPDEQVLLLYRTDEGVDGKLKLKVASLRQYLPTVQVGDRLVKRQGDYLPRKAAPEIVGSQESGSTPQA